MTTIQIENLSDIKKKVTVEVPQEIVETTIAGRYKELGKKAQIKGFRKGKVPMNILKSYFHKDVEAEAIQEIVEKTFDPKLKEENILLFSVIKIDPEDLVQDKPFKYTAEIEVPPAIKVADYKGIALTEAPVKVEDSDVDLQIEKVMEQHARLVSIAESATVAKSDHVVVDVAAQSDGQEIKELTVADYHLELGRDFFVPDFDSKLEGMKVDEKKTFSMDFAEDFPRKSLAGKTVSFQVTLKDAKHKVLPELDDDFAKDLGEFETLEQLKASVRDRLQRAEEEKAKEKIREQILDALLAKNEFEVPDFIVEAQIDKFLNQTLGSLINYGLDPRTMPPHLRPNRELFREPAVRMVKAGLMLKAISEEEKLEVTEGDLQAAIEERAKESNFSADHLMDKLEKADALGEFRVSLLNDKVFELIKSHATITEEEPAPPTEESEDEPQAEETPKPAKKKRKEQ